MFLWPAINCKNERTANYKTVFVAIITDRLCRLCFVVYLKEVVTCTKTTIQITLSISLSTYRRCCAFYLDMVVIWASMFISVVPLSKNSVCLTTCQVIRCSRAYKACDQGITNWTGTETFANGPKLAKLLPELKLKSLLYNVCNGKFAVFGALLRDKL